MTNLRRTGMPSPYVAPPLVELGHEKLRPGMVLNGKVGLETYTGPPEDTAKVTIVGKETYGILKYWQNKFYTEETTVYKCEGGRFSFQLPDTLSPSYKADYGGIKYYIRMEWGKGNVLKKPFSVVLGNEIEMDDDANYVVNLEQCNLKVETTLPDKNIFAGQNLQISFELKNETPVIVRGVRFKLVRHTRFHLCEDSCMNSKQKPSDRKCLHLEDKTISESATWPCRILTMEDVQNQIELQIPMKLYPTFNSSFCHVSYKIKMKIYLERIGKQVFEIPVYGRDTAPMEPGIVAAAPTASEREPLLIDFLAEAAMGNGPVPPIFYYNLF